MAGLRIGCSTSTYFNIISISTFKAFEWPHLPTVVMRTWRNSLKHLWSSHWCCLGRRAGVQRCCVKECNSCHAKEHERTNSLCCLQCLLSKPAIRSCETSLHHTARSWSKSWFEDHQHIASNTMTLSSNVINNQWHYQWHYQISSHGQFHGVLWTSLFGFIHRTDTMKLPTYPTAETRRHLKAISQAQRVTKSCESLKGDSIIERMETYGNTEDWKPLTIAGWWYTYPIPTPLKNIITMSSSVGMITFPTEWKNNPLLL